MRYLFVSSTTGGGSGMSQRQLAAALRARGHDVVVLADPGTRSWRRQLYKRSVNLTTKLGRSRLRWLRPVLLAPQRLFGRRVRVDASFEVPVVLSEMPENAFRALRHHLEPDVVVASSIDRVSWRRLRAAAGSDGVPTVLYLREEAAIGHLAITGAPPDLLLANAESHAVAARAVGFDCEVVPSVVDLGAAGMTSSRQTALLINPIESHGGDRIWDLASACPEIEFVLQESWPLDEGAVEAIEARRREHPNVALRRRTSDVASIYRDARVLLAPHRLDNRPRVIAEAQHNGIPVLATAHPGLVESVGDGGVALSTDFDTLAWARELEALWSDEQRYADLVERARRHAGRSEIDPDRVLDRFEELTARLVAG